MKFFPLFLILFFTFYLRSEESDGNISVDLKEPVYQDGVIFTDKGGVVTGPKLRVQAAKIRYTHSDQDRAVISKIEAEENLILEFGEYIFIGDRLIYDLEKKEGTLFRGRTESEPWYLGGEKIELRSDGSYYIQNAFITTSENSNPEWELLFSSAIVNSDRDLSSKDVRLRVLKTTLLKLPYLNANLTTIFDNPLTYRFRWGGVQGPRLGLTYELFLWERWKSFFRLDYRLTRGPGAGFETHYRSQDRKINFQSINYISCDSSLSNIHENIRYRVEGKYSHSMMDDKTTILVTYDKVSDIDLPSEYHDNDFEIETSERTQILVRRQESDWIAKFYSRVRVNNFQTVKQELPTFSTYFKPFLIGQTGILSENQAIASYLNFQYANNLKHVHDYNSTRLEYRPQLYRSFVAGPWTLTPEVGAVAIFYGDSPSDNSQLLILGKAGCRLNTMLFRQYGRFKHVIEPYTYYRYYSSPTSSPHQHYIFDINDGWYRLNQWTWGVKNSVLVKNRDSQILQLFSSDLYLHAFIDTPTMKQVIPKIYGKVDFAWTSNLHSIISTAWDLEEHQLDHFNFRSEWTLNADFALATEFRHRDSFCWRKADSTNFILDSYRTIEELEHSAVSDRRDTFLVHFFYRFHPKWSGECVSRYGWNRKHQPDYLEYELNLFTTIRTGWNWKFSYQHLEGDNRVAVYLNLGLPRPKL
jgi:hypothetical protein